MPSSGEIGDDFDQTHHRQRFHGDEDFHPGRGHVASADPEKQGVGPPASHGPDDGGPVILAGFFAGDDQDGRRGHFCGVPKRMISGFLPGVRP